MVKPMREEAMAGSGRPGEDKVEGMRSIQLTLVNARMGESRSGRKSLA